MNVSCAFHFGDAGNVTTLLKWCNELGGARSHDLFLMPAKELSVPDELLSEAKTAFKTVTIVPDDLGIVSRWQNEKKDAAGPNSMMRQLAWYFYLNNLGPWLFWEPDAVFLVPRGLDRLDAEYKTCGKPFMGARVSIGGVIHMTGNAIYPQDTISLCPSLFRPQCRVLPNGEREELAFDVVIAKEVLPKMHDTKLIQQVFCNPHPNVVPTFPDEASLSVISPDAVLFHRNKDLTLISRLRERLGACRHGVAGEPQTASVSACETPGRVINPKVHTYFAPVPQMNREEQEWLIGKWKESWSRNGWEPVVLLPEADAEKYFSDHFKHFPTINPSEYEKACWTRWVAMTSCGGLLTDYDCMNFGFTPNDLPRCDKLRLFDGYVPCVVYGTKQQYADMVGLFLKTPPDEKHWSDMLALEKLTGSYETGEECCEWGKTGWDTKKLVHFSHHACGKRNRKEVIAEAEAWLNKLDEPKEVAEITPIETRTLKDQFRASLDDVLLKIDGKIHRQQMFRDVLREKGLLAQKKKRKFQRSSLVI